MEHELWGKHVSEGEPSLDLPSENNKPSHFCKGHALLAQVCTYSLAFGLLSILFHSSWRATAHTWVNTLCSSSCPVRSLFATAEDHWPLQGPPFVFILHSAHCRAWLRPQINLTSPALSVRTHEGHRIERPSQKSLQILPVPSKQDSQRCALPQEADIAQPLRSGREGSFTTRTLIVSALVMSACFAANSSLPLSPNPPSHSLCQSCQQINPRLPTTHSSLS